MLTAIALLSAQTVRHPATAADLAGGAPLSSRAAAAIVPVHAAYAKVAAEQAKQAPPASDRDRLERLLDEDQAGRAALAKIDLTSLLDADRKAASKAIWHEILTHDLADQRLLKTMMPARGWFVRSRYGEKAATAAFLIVQHAVNDPALMRDALARMKPLVAGGEVRGPDYALLHDRISLEFDHKPQLYGSQVACSGGKWVPSDLADPAHLDARRKAMGFDKSEAEYLDYFKDQPCN